MSQTTRLSKIGNSFGIILNKKILKEAEIMETSELIIEVKKGIVMITPVKKQIEVNLDRSTWDDQFKKAIKATGKPEKSVWPDNVSQEADKDWTW